MSTSFSFTETLSKDVFKPRTSTGSELFYLFGRSFENNSGQIVLTTVTTFSNTNLVGLRHIKREKPTLPVDVRRSKTSLRRHCLNSLKCTLGAETPIRAFSLTWPASMQIGTKERVNTRKEFNSNRTGLGHQHGHRFIVSQHQYGCHDVMWNALLSSWVRRRKEKKAFPESRQDFEATKASTC